MKFIIRSRRFCFAVDEGARAPGDAETFFLLLLLLFHSLFPPSFSPLVYCITRRIGVAADRNAVLKKNNSNLFFKYHIITLVRDSLFRLCYIFNKPFKAVLSKLK